MKKLFITIIFLVLAILGIIYVAYLYMCEDDWCFYYEWQKARHTNNFEECVTRGFPVLESFPRLCRTADGRNFVEVIVRTAEVEIYFREKMWERGVENLDGAMPIEGFDPNLFIGAFPNLVEEDFDEVNAIGGYWELKDELIFVSTRVGVATSADGTIDEVGMKELLVNLEERLGLEVRFESDVDELLDLIS